MYCAIKPSSPCKNRYFYHQGGSLGFVFSMTVVAFLLGLSGLY